MHELSWRIVMEKSTKSLPRQKKILKSRPISTRSSIGEDSLKTSIVEPCTRASSVVTHVCHLQLLPPNSAVSASPPLLERPPTKTACRCTFIRFHERPDGKADEEEEGDEVLAYPWSFSFSFSHNGNKEYNGTSAGTTMMAHNDEKATGGRQQSTAATRRPDNNEKTIMTQRW